MRAYVRSCTPIFLDRIVVMALIANLHFRGTFILWVIALNNNKRIWIVRVCVLRSFVIMWLRNYTAGCFKAAQIEFVTFYDPFAV